MQTLRQLGVLLLLTAVYAVAHADIGADISACVSALPLTGGVCDFRGKGPQPTSTVISLSRPVTLLLDGTQITTSASPGISVGAGIAGVRIRGTLATTVLKETTYTASIISGTAITDLEIQGVSFNGSGGTLMQNASCLNGTGGVQNQNGVYLTNSAAGNIQRIRIVGNRFTALCQHAVYIQNASDVLVEDNMIWNVSDGIRFTGVTYGKILNNSLNDQMFSAGTTSVFGIAIALDSTNANGGNWPACSNVQISNNSVVVGITTGMGYSNSEGILVHAGTNIIITGNILTNVADGIGVNPFVSADTINNVVIEGNNYLGPTSTNASSGLANDGIQVAGSPSTSIPSSITVANNTIEQANQLFPSSSYGGIFVAANKITITGNVVSNVGATGIMIQNPSNYLIMSNNYIYNVSSVSGYNGVGIAGNYASGTSSGRIRSNFVTSAFYGYNFALLPSSPGLLFGANDSSSVTTALNGSGNVTVTTF